MSETRGNNNGALLGLHNGALLGLFLLQQGNNVIKAFLVLNPTNIINVLTLSEGPPQSLPPGGRVKIVQASGLQIIFDCPGGLHCIVEWDLVKHVMDNMCGANVVMEKIEDAIVPVNGGESPFHPGPLIFPIKRDSWVSVVEISVHDKPEIKQHERETVPKSNCQDAMVM